MGPEMYIVKRVHSWQNHETSGNAVETNVGSFATNKHKNRKVDANVAISKTIGHEEERKYKRT